jgi:hypothetical protein
MVCEGLQLQEAAERLNIDPERLRLLLAKRDAACPQDSDDLWQ